MGKINSVIIYFVHKNILSILLLIHTGPQKTVCPEVSLYAYSGTYAYSELYVGIYFSSY